jgi:hypothetical protein
VVGERLSSCMMDRRQPTVRDLEEEVAAARLFSAFANAARPIRCLHSYQEIHHLSTLPPRSSRGDIWHDYAAFMLTEISVHNYYLTWS